MSADEIKAAVERVKCCLKTEDISPDFEDIRTVMDALIDAQKRVEQLELAKPEHWLPKSITVADIAARAEKAEAALVEVQKKLEQNQREHFSCFSCNDGHTPLYCLNCAESIAAANAAQGEKGTK